eukprot:Gregarina_sp_Poly_1__11421@NODE_975_length_5501_cov_78_097902_g681_i1_p3_GENE_NODE_975_length_5501_cov_78_097902_g681_i1NODE_975_length_5501_cov_78_097902_g681_i1_p3_ORF_typecomplete_len158_score7_34UQ_con/PF00179_26/1e43ProkE2_B/PF14461_6/1_1e07RWD/PF05773_22/0_009ProkE2_A/PF14457_6/0_2_NODE_975_length_5501_cov_78_097902_g681_i127523225
MADACGRLIREVREYHAHPEPDVVLKVSEESLFDWEAVITGPVDTPYTGGKFKLKIRCPSDYPMLPPNIQFLTPIFHPNVHWTTGEICLDVLKSNWTPAWTLQFVCRALIALMCDPNADSPLNCDAGNLVRSGDLRGYYSLAKMYTIEYAMLKTNTE